MSRETLAVMLFAGGLVWVAVCLVMSLRLATYETTRPWAGFQQRTRRTKDGRRKVETYWSKGPASTKATLDVRYARLSAIGTIAMLASFFL